jgi:hypothetical protein
MGRQLLAAIMLHCVRRRGSPKCNHPDNRTQQQQRVFPHHEDGINGGFVQKTTTGGRSLA